MNETLNADRPSDQQIDDDNKFDNWLIAFERKMNQLASKKPPHG
jgi:hypothetical protein